MLKFKIFKNIGSIIPLSFVRKFLEFLNHYIIKLFKRIDENNLFLAGAGIAYSLFLGMIPLILLVFSLLSNIFDVKTLQNQIFQIIDTVIPYPVYGSYMKKVIETRLPEFVGYSTVAGYTGAIGLLITSTWIFSSMRTILNKIFQTSIQKNPFVGLLRDLGMVVLLVVFITLSTFVFPIMNLILEVAKTSQVMSSFNISALWNSIVWIASILIMIIMFFSLYYLIPYEKLPKRVALMSAIWTTVLWEIARNVFGYYIQYFFSSNALYGAFALIVVILFWVFYSSCIFIIGAEIGQLYRERLIQKVSKK
ncbi:MAG: YihY/virulence factor BrkB family protein [Ignavibacteria bacterium]|nr:YihY/virulence factor BrkB family protein [Ignavibacteria bacterium]